MATHLRNWFGAAASGRVAIWRGSKREVWLEIDLPPAANRRDPESVRRALKEALAALQEAVADTELIRQLSQTG